jgi:tripartite-type tricarboxylate transporter receptor subunit TctC
VAYLVAGAVALWAASATAADFSGKRITMIVPFAEGGGGSVYTRFLAPLFEKHLPGNPTAIVQNIPGGGSIKGINEFARKAGNEGLMVANTGSGTIFAVILDDPAVKYDFNDFVPLVTSPFGVMVYARPEAGAGPGEVEKLKGKALKTPARSPTAGDMPMLLSYELLGLDVKPIFGLSSGKGRLAYMRNEVQINGDNMASFAEHIQPLIKDGTAVPLFTLGYANEKGEIVRDPMAPDVPSFIEAYERIHGKKPSGPGFEAWKTVFNIRVMAAKMLLLPKAAKPDVLAAYQAAIQKVVNDPVFKGKEGAEIFGPYQQTLGKDAERVMKDAATISPEAKAWLKKWLKDRYDVS